MRKANINYINKITGLTPLHTAIEAQINSQVVKFLLSNGANLHIEDLNGLDCCDKAEQIERYAKIKEFRKKECKVNPELRIKMNETNMLSINSPIKVAPVGTSSRRLREAAFSAAKMSKAKPKD